MDPEDLSDESDDDDSQSTVSAGDMPPLVQSHPDEAYHSFEYLTGMGNLNGLNTQCTTQFDFKPSPNARRVSEDSNAGDDSKPSSVVHHGFSADDSYVMPKFDLDPTQHNSSSPAEFGGSVSHAPARAPYNADTFVDSLLNGDFSGHDFLGHDFSRDPIVTEEDEVVEI